MPPGPLLFRFRFLCLAAIYLLGFTAPWDRWLHLDGPESTWLSLAGYLAHATPLTFSSATILVLVAATVCTFGGAFLRTWAARWLSPSVVRDGALTGSSIVAGGPYCYLRNPLYAGLLLHTAGLAILMPVSGSLFALAGTCLLLTALIRAEENFLGLRSGSEYVAYRKRVPRLLPRFRPSPEPQAPPASSWPSAILSEFYMWCAACSFAVLGWRYNAFILTQAVLVSLGIALVARAFAPNNTPAAQP